jgi:K+-sensing histidine kinase KdpD
MVATIVTGKRRFSLTSLGARLRPVGGLFLVVLAAGVMARLFLHSPYRLLVPIGFVAILVALAARFGALVGILGAVLAALVVARYLYSPLGSFHVDDVAARKSLSWMLVGASALSFLLFPPQNRSHR